MTLPSPPVVPGSSPIDRSPLRTISPRRRLLFIAALLGIVFAVQEACFRVAFPLPEVVEFNRSHYARSHRGESGPAKAGKGVRNLIYRIDSEPDGFSFDQTLNLYGFRGPSFSVRPPRDRPRVLFIGDSFVEGMGAGDGETIPIQFARILGGTRQVDALNLGVIGAGLDDYARIARDGLRLLHPDAVYLFVYANDLPAPPYPADADLPSPPFPRVNPYVPRALQVVAWLRRGWPVARLFPTGPFPFFRPVPSPLNPLTKGPLPPGIDPRILDAMRRGKSNPSLLVWARLVESSLRHDFTRGGGAAPYLSRIAALCRDSGAELRLVYVPASVAVHPVHIEAQERLAPGSFANMTAPAGATHRAQQVHLRRVAESLEIPFLDLTDAFIHAEATRGRMYWPVDTHCNAAGYRLVAEACARDWTGRPRTRPRPASTLALESESFVAPRLFGPGSAHPDEIPPASRRLMSERLFVTSRGKSWAR